MACSPIFEGGLDFSGPVEKYFIDPITKKPFVNSVVSRFALVGVPARQDHPRAVEALRKLDVPYIVLHFRDKLHFPAFRNARLHTLINQSLNWQHQLCRFPKLNPDIRTLFVDHSCAQSSSVTNTLVASHAPKVGGAFPVGAYIPYQLTPASVASLGLTVALDPSVLPHQSVSGGPMSLPPPSNAAALLEGFSWRNEKFLSLYFMWREVTVGK